MPESLPSRARVVIVGGGVVGCSIAYHLVERGCADVVLLEKSDLTTGATWHAAGLVGQLRSSRNVTRMIQYSVKLYGDLETRTGQATGWSPVGSLRIASSTERMNELRKIANTGRGFGLDVHLLDPSETKQRFPIADLEGVVGSAYVESDGHADPSMLTRALTSGARAGGATIVCHTRVTGFSIESGSVTGVETDRGVIECDAVVNAAGMWARRIGAMAGVNVPVVPLEHQFLVTTPIPDLPRDLPVTRDPDNAIYYRGEVGGLVVGGFEPEPLPWCVDGVPWEFSAELLEPNLDQFEPLSRSALRRTPCLESVGVKKIVNGPDGYSPDGSYVLGPAPELRNFFVAAGMNCFGIAGAGGVGRALAEWILDGEPSLDLWPLDIRRFGGPQFRSTRLVVDRCMEHYPKHYSIAWPMYAHRSARRLRRSPLHDHLSSKRSVFGEKNGWERVQWLAPQGVEPCEEMTYGRPSWHDVVAEEVHAVREGVALLDQTSFGKIDVRGPGALDALQRLSTRDIDRPPGTLSYTQMCNERGGIECDVTIARTDDERFYIITGTSFLAHDLDWISRHLPRNGSALATDATSSFAVINLGGPRSRDLLRRVSDDDVSHEGFPFAGCRRIHIGCAPLLALRVSYHGELGWELHIPTEFGAYVYETLWSAGEELGVRDIGYRALESCRLEKGYLYWSADVTPDDNPYEAGLGFNVNLDKGDFLGREALARIKAAGPARKLCYFTLAEETQLFGTEPILRDGRVLGIVTSGGYGHHVGKTIAYGYLPIEDSGHRDYSIAAFGIEGAATRHSRAVHDPDRKRMLR